MKIYIMRHGEAQDFYGQGCIDDSQRALSTQGELEVKEMTQWLSDNDVSPKHIFVSPYVRAIQTCDIVSSTITAPVTTLDFITPLDNAKPVHDFIDGWLSEFLSTSTETCKELNQHSLLIISHMPLVCYLVAELTQSNNTPIFATAGIAYIDYDIQNMCGDLLDLTSPTV